MSERGADGVRSAPATPPNSGPVGILGGTFDPVHVGHLCPALEVLQGLSLAEVRLVPGRVPPHRPRPRTPPERRLELLERAVTGVPGLVVDDRELRRDGPSYTVDTLRSLRRELGGRPLCFLLGSDAFQALASWHRWRELGELAHLVVMGRPGQPTVPSGELARWADGRWAASPAALRESPAGRLFHQPVTQLAISATDIRIRLMQGRSVRYLVPDSIRELLAGAGWYGYPQP